MTCAACQANVQRVLTRQPGVSDAAVNLMTGQARVAFDPALIEPAQLIAAVESIGYGASLPSAESSATAAEQERDAAQLDEFRDLRRKALVSGLLGLAAMFVSMPLMTAAAAAHAHDGVADGVAGRVTDGAAAGDPVMQWAMALFDPGLRAAAPWLYAVSPRTLSWLLLVVTASVMAWAGRRFYVAGTRALLHRVPDMNSLVAVGTGAAFVYSAVATIWPAVLLRSGVPADVY